MRFHRCVDTTQLLVYKTSWVHFVLQIHVCTLSMFNPCLWLQLRVLCRPHHCAYRWVPCRTGIIFNIFSPKRTFDRDLISHIQQEIDLRPVRIKSWYKKKERDALVKDHRYACAVCQSVCYMFKYNDCLFTNALWCLSFMLCYLMIRCSFT